MSTQGTGKHALEMLANMPLGIPLEDWSRLSSIILQDLNAVADWKARAEAAETRVKELEAALNKIASWSQSSGLLWRQIEARAALAAALERNE
jgi:hypothetical protein